MKNDHNHPMEMDPKSEEHHHMPEGDAHSEHMQHALNRLMTTRRMLKCSMRK